MYVLNETVPSWKGDPTYFAAVVKEKHYYSLQLVSCGVCEVSYEGVVKTLALCPQEIYYGLPQIISWNTRCIHCDGDISYSA